MAVLDFPNSPALNQQYVASNGATYQWDGTTWVVTGGPPAVPTGPAGGDLAGAYPNPTLTPAAKSKWQIVGSTLTPVDNTKAVTLAGNLDSLPVGALSGTRFSMVDTSVAIRWNRDAALGSDNAKPAWVTNLGGSGVSDAWGIYRAPTGAGSLAQFLNLDNTGKLTLTNNIVLGPPSLYTTLLAAGNAYETSINKPFGAQDTTKVGWAVSHYVDANDAIVWWHRKTGDAANVGAEYMRLRGSDGKLVASLADASVTNAMLASGATTPTAGIATAGIPVSGSWGSPYSNWILVVSMAAITVKAGQRVLLLDMSGLQYVGSNTSNIVFKGWARNGGVFASASWTFSATASGLSMWPMPTLNFVDTPGAGSFTYALYIFVASNAGSITSRADSTGALAAITLA